MRERILRIDKPWNWKQFFMQWEWLLFAVFILIHIINSLLSPFYFHIDTFLTAPMNFLDKAFIVLPMMFIIILGNIDISVGSIVAFSSVMLAVLFNAGVPLPLALLGAVIISTLCGGINGILQVLFKELPAMIITLATMIIFRGAAYIILEDRAAGGFPQWFSFFAWGYIGPFPFILLVFSIAAVIFGLVLHKTGFGRKIYGIGSSRLACIYSGLKTDQILITVSLLTGFMSGITAVFLTSRMGSTRPNVALGYELDVIAMVVLGGVSTSGGTGRIAGPLLAVFIIGFLNYGLGLMNISAQIILIVLGALLVTSVLVMSLRFNKRKK